MPSPCCSSGRIGASRQPVWPSCPTRPAQDSSTSSVSPREVNPLSHIALCCMSHSPLLNLPGPSEELLEDINAQLAQARAFVADFDPELVVIFSPDHYNGFFYRLMPPFCIGSAATGVGDYGTYAGPLDVPAAVADEMAAAAWDSGVDVALSAAMEVDHGTVQPLEVLFGDAASRPVIPVFINSVATPLGPLKRTRALGAAIGVYLG